jgi:hypothetical protein
MRRIMIKRMGDISGGATLCSKCGSKMKGVGA